MIKTIFLVASRNGIQRMTKTLPDLYRGEIAIKMNITIPEAAFKTPTLEQNVVINDWADGIDLEDVEFKQNIITAEEAAIIKERRLTKMRDILEAQGFTVTKEESDEVS